MKNDQPYRDERKANQEFRQIDDTYVFDESSGLYTPKSIAEKKHRRKNSYRILGTVPIRLHGRDWLTIIIASLTLMIVGTYTEFARRQWVAAHDTLGEIQQQTKLQRQQLVGSQAARINFPNPEVIQDSNTVKFLFDNGTGQLTGTVENFRAKVSRQNIWSHKIIGDPIIYEIKKLPVGPRSAETDTRHLSWIFPLQVAADKFPGNDVTIIEATFSYDNGFGDKIPYEGCFFYLPPTNVPFGPQWGFGGLQGGPHPCDVEGQIREFRRRMNEPH